MSKLAQRLFDELNSGIQLQSIEAAALALYEDQSLSHTRRLAYYQVYQYCQNNPY